MTDEAKGIPSNLAELAGKSLDGFTLTVAYIIELSHGLMGFFPAIVSETDEMVVMVDRELMERVWKMLTPRKSNLVHMAVLYNEELGVVYTLAPSSSHLKGMRALASSEPIPIMNEKRFEQLTADDAKPFKWVPGLVNDGMSHEEFVDTVHAALEECAA